MAVSPTFEVEDPVGCMSDVKDLKPLRIPRHSSTRPCTSCRTSCRSRAPLFQVGSGTLPCVPGPVLVLAFLALCTLPVDADLIVGRLNANYDVKRPTFKEVDTLNANFDVKQPTSKQVRNQPNTNYKMPSANVLRNTNLLSKIP